MKNIVLGALTAGFSLLTSLVFAQNPGSVKGQVADQNQKSVEAATVSLLKASDSSLVKISAADKTGRFSFEQVASGRYLVAASGVGFTASHSAIFELSQEKNSIDLKTITLSPKEKSLSGVTVTAKRPLVEQKIDRTIVNVDASPTNVGASALEVLEKSPGIMVDKDGNISLKGKDGVMVLIDGRPTQLGGTDLANMLRSMNASQLDQVEIMTNPPAKYDAAGNAGIINIKTKKTRQFGYNGTLTLGYGQGRFPKINEALNFNYRAGKVNLFTNLSHNYRKNFEELDIQRNFRNASTKEITSSFDQEARMSSRFNSYNAKLGLDYFASKKTTLGVVVSGFTNPGYFENRNKSIIEDRLTQTTSQTQAFSHTDNKFRNFSTNLNFRQLLDTAGKELTADVDYITYDGEDAQSLSNYYFDQIGHETQKGDTLYGKLPQQINIWSGRVDYLQPMKKGARFEAGVKSSIVKTDNNAIYDTVHNGELQHDYNRSNHFIYEENINAAYVNLSTPLSKKISAQFGLRLENTISKGKQITTAKDFTRSYTNLFPTAYFQYAVNEKHNLGLNYGRRIRRPNYESLNPFIEFLDRYTYQQGNPNLKPQFSHNIELSHSYNKFLTTTLNYTRTTDIIQQVIEQDNEKKETFIKQSNIANQRQYGLAVNFVKSINKWWTTNLNVNAFTNYFNGIVSGDEVTVEATMMAVQSTQQFKLNKNLTAELSGFYRTAGLEGVIKTKPMGMINIGMSQQVLKNKGTLRLTVRDILYTQKFQAVTKYGNVDAAFQNKRDSRVVNLGFTYRFSKGKMNGGPKRKTNGSASDEQNRVGGGSGN